MSLILPSISFLFVSPALSYNFFKRLWLCWVFVVACGLSLVVVRGLLWLQNTGSSSGSEVGVDRRSCPRHVGLLVLQPAIPISPALEGWSLTTGPPGKSQPHLFFIYIFWMFLYWIFFCLFLFLSFVGILGITLQCFHSAALEQGLQTLATWARLDTLPVSISNISLEHS